MHLGFTVQTLIKMTVQSSAGVTKSTLVGTVGTLLKYFAAHRAELRILHYDTNLQNLKFKIYNV